jgi:hypothetical protein
MKTRLDCAIKLGLPVDFIRRLYQLIHAEAISRQEADATKTRPLHGPDE